MKYQPKFQICPYRSKSGKCTHKGIDGKFCIVNKPERCHFCLEWFALIESIYNQEKSIPTPINPTKNTISNKNNEQ